LKSINSAELNSALHSANPPTIFDVRKKPVFDSDPALIANATWQVFDQVEDWASTLSADMKNKPVVVYCVHGHEVSQSVTKKLNELGFDASYLEGGIAQWIDEGFSVA